MPRKPYNPNTLYKRKKLQQQAHRYYNKWPADKTNKRNATTSILLAMILIIALAMLFVI